MVVVHCSEGMTVTPDTVGNCCWPGQAWSTSRQACVGVPSCPDGFVHANSERCIRAPLVVAPMVPLEAPSTGIRVVLSVFVGHGWSTMNTDLVPTDPYRVGFGERIGLVISNLLWLGANFTYHLGTDGAAGRYDGGTLWRPDNSMPMADPMPPPIDSRSFPARSSMFHVGGEFGFDFGPKFLRIRPYAFASFALVERTTILVQPATGTPFSRTEPSALLGPGLNLSFRVVGPLYVGVDARYLISPSDSDPTFVQADSAYTGQLTYGIDATRLAAGSQWPGGPGRNDGVSLFGELSLRL